MDDFFNYDSKASGSKGLVLIGDKLLLYRRDYKTDVEPGKIDVPGGGPEPGETPFETFQREVKEEFGLEINKYDVVYARKYLSQYFPGRNACFPVVKLEASREKDIVFGDEGLECMLMSLDEYLDVKDAWAIFQARSGDYREKLKLAN